MQKTRVPVLKECTLTLLNIYDVLGTHSPVKTSLGLRSIWELAKSIDSGWHSFYNNMAHASGGVLGGGRGWGVELHHVGSSSVAAHRPSSCVVLVPERVASVVVAHGLSCPWHVGSFKMRDWTHVLCTGRQVIRRVPRTLVLHPAQWLLVISPKYQD